MTQSVLWGCQSVLEKLLAILSEFGINLVTPNNFSVGEIDFLL